MFSAKKICIALLCYLLILCSLYACTPTALELSAETTGTSSAEETTTPETKPIPTETPTTVTDPPPTVPEEPLFQYDKYLLSAEAKNQLTDSEQVLYRKLVDAVMDHSGVVEGFDSNDQFHKIWSVLITEFVPVRWMIQTFRESESPFTYEDGTATLHFIGDKETCDHNYEAFAGIINEALALIKADDSEWERIAKLYLYVSDHMDYGNVNLVYGISPDQYNCIVYGLGICGNYADYLNMLASQIGFETIQGSSIGTDETGGADHAWSMILVDGQWYHFDACWQASNTFDMSMQYFAFDTQYRYDTLARNNPSGVPCEVEMFNMDDYTYERTELPFCENRMPVQERNDLYASVINDYFEGISKDAT